MLRGDDWSEATHRRVAMGVIPLHLRSENKRSKKRKKNSQKVRRDVNREGKWEKKKGKGCDIYEGLRETRRRKRERTEGRRRRRLEEGMWRTKDRGNK